ncbi:MAG: ribonuclease [Actinomycetota bacterium]|jgi:ribonuclease E|nr:ribonuclease [Actinomycetota bacterium]
MTDLNRLSDETNDETAAPAAPIGQRDEPETSPETAPAEGASAANNGARATEDDDLVPNGGAQLGPDGLPRKKRRRGTRGGQRRKKPAGANGAAGSDASEDADEDDGDDDDALESMSGGEDWTDATADRGLTDDDIAEQAREEAGLIPPGPGLRPKIGDSRPAPSVAATAASGTGTSPGASADDGVELGPDGAPKKRRRRRGGRGRTKGGQAGGGQSPDQGGQSRAPSPAQSRGQGRSASGSGRGSGRGAVQYVDAGEMGDVDVDGTALLDSLDDETLQRRRGTSRKGRPAGRYLMVVHVRPDGFAHIGVLEGRQLIEHYISTPTDENTSIDGNIYLGRVQNVLPGMEAAFIDIGTPKNGVLYRGDVAYDANDVEGGEKPRIERVLRNGQSIIVQVTKNPIAHKGARLTQEVSLAGRFVVMVPGQPQTYGISKRLPDDERKRLRRVLDRLRPADAGLIVRTAAEGATEEELERDMLRLNAQWTQISQIAKKAKPGSLLYKEPQLAIRLIREEFTKEFRGVVIDDAKMYEEVHSYIDAIAPELAERVEFYDAAAENLPVFEKFHVHEQLHKALDRKVWLPSGGSLIIERTEALTVIDVNTGKNVGTSNLEETVYRNNLEAAEVVARELRLRDIGGIIVIDFIDMEIRHNREAVEEAFRQALARDKTRTQVFPISELGLVEMTRKRVSEGLVEAFSSTCPHCNGRGFVVDESLLE